MTGPELFVFAVVGVMLTAFILWALDAVRIKMETRRLRKQLLEVDAEIEALMLQLRRQTQPGSNARFSYTMQEGVKRWEQ